MLLLAGLGWSMTQTLRKQAAASEPEDDDGLPSDTWSDPTVHRLAGSGGAQKA
jgi:hypothetical protein